MRILVQRHKWAIILLKCVAITGNSDHYRAMLNKFFLTKIEEETFGLNRTALGAIQPKLNSMFCAQFLKTTLSAAGLISLGHLGAAI